MADHYTRVTCGGAPPTTIPDKASANANANAGEEEVVGVLYGTVAENSGITIINQAQECASLDVLNNNNNNNEASEMIASLQTSLGLHQAVYPQQEILGWYHVVTTNGAVEPTESDYHTSLQLQRSFTNNNNARCYFGLLVLNQNQQATTGGNNKNKNNNKELPFLLYQLENVSADTTTISPPILVQSNVVLQTHPSEQFAVEKILTTIPAPTTSSSSTTLTTNVVDHSPFLQKINTYQDALQILTEKVNVLVDFMAKLQENDDYNSYDSFEFTANTTTAAIDTTNAQQQLTKLALLKRINTLTLVINPMRVLSNNISIGSNNTIDNNIIPTLAVLAQTMDAIQHYTDTWNEAARQKSYLRGP